MDSIPAVGAEIQPPNPLGAFSNVLGIKQQMLGLQQQQAAIETARAEAAQAQQKNVELQQAQALAASSVKGNGYRNANGTLNTQKLSEDIQALGPYAAPYANQIVSRANEMVQNQSALNKLNTEQQAELSDVFTSLSSDPHLTHGKVIDALSAAAERNPQLIRLTNSWSSGLPPDASPAQLQQIMKRWALAAHSGQTAPSGQMVLTKQGNVFDVTNPASPFSGPQGPTIQPGLPVQLGTQPGTQAPAVISPSGQASPITNAPPPNAPPTSPQAPNPAAGQTNWWNPAPGQVQSMQQQATMWTKTMTDAPMVAKQYQESSDALSRILGLVQQPGLWTGSAFNKFTDLKNLVAPLGIDTTNATNANELVKNIARNASTIAAQVGDTDAARSLQEVGQPNTHVNKQALVDITRQSLAAVTARRDLAILQASVGPGDWQAAQQRTIAFTKIPNLIGAIEADQIWNSPDMTPQQKQAAVKEFIDRNKFSGATLSKSLQQYHQLMSAVPQMQGAGP